MKVTESVTAERIQPRPEGLIILLPDRKIEIPWQKRSPRLASATDEQRLSAELSRGGYGIHWRLLDEDLSIGGLLRDING